MAQVGFSFVVCVVLFVLFLFAFCHASLLVTGIDCIELLVWLCLAEWKQGTRWVVFGCACCLVCSLFVCFLHASLLVTGVECIQLLVWLCLAEWKAWHKMGSVWLCVLSCLFSFCLLFACVSPGDRH